MIAHPEPPSLDMMIVGAPKAGTSSLHRNLEQHPGVSTHATDEMGFFVSDRQYAMGYTAAFARYFSTIEPGKRIVAKNAGVMQSRPAIARLYDHNPGVHLVALLRNPVDRAYSNYWHARRRGHESLRTFEEALEAETARLSEDPRRWRHCAYVENGRYAHHLAQVSEVFPPEQLHIYLTADLAADANAVCRELFVLLNVDSTAAVVTHRRNVAGAARSERLARAIRRPTVRAIGRTLLPHRIRDSLLRGSNRFNNLNWSPPAMNPDTHRMLTMRFKNDVAELASVIDRDITHWVT